MRKANEPEEAIRHLRRALELKPDFYEAQMNLANAMIDVGGQSRTLSAKGYERLKSKGVAVKQGHARSLMPSYNEVDGIPSHANRWMLRDVLRAGKVYADGWTKYEAEQADYELLKAANYLLCVARKVNDTYDVVWYAFGVDSSQFQIRWFPDYQLFATNSFVAGTVVAGTAVAEVGTTTKRNARWCGESNGASEGRAELRV